MGQQQLLLIVLGVIIVGIAVVVGINVFTASATEANRNAIIGDMTMLSSMAQQHYRKPTEMGGGGNTFTGWTIPSQLAVTANGAYVETVGAQSVTIVGKGTELGNDGTDSVEVTMIVSSTNITSTTINN